MKLIQINICNYGSTGNLMKKIHQKAIDHGIDSWCFYGKENSNKEELRMKRFGTKLGFFSHVFISLLFDRYGFGSKSDTKKLVEEIDRINPDIIHLHNIHSFLVNFEILFDYIKRSNIKVIWTLHDSWAYTAFCGNPDLYNCDKWKTICGKCPHRLNLSGRKRRSLIIDYTKDAYYRKKKAFTSLPDLYIACPSNWIKTNLEESFLKNEKIGLFRNGIDLDIFTSEAIKLYPGGDNELKEKFNIPCNVKIILGVASVWTEAKGFNTMLDIAEIIDKEYCVVLVGLTKKQIKKLSSNVIGIEQTSDRTELAALYSIADVFVNPTLSDTYPTVNLEAIACGTPVVTYDTNGSPESVGPGCGFIVEQKNIKELISKAILAINECDSKVCRDYAEKNFSDIEAINRYLYTYKLMTKQ